MGGDVLYKNKRILSIIPARGGSKGIPHKNIMPILDKPLIAYSIEESQKSKYIDCTLVSTDDHEIKKVSLNYGASVPFLRPEELSSDSAKSIDVVLHGVEYFNIQGEKFDYVVLLQPTSPLRKAKDIDEAIELLLKKEGKSLVSVCESEDNPVLMRTIENEKLVPIVKFGGSDLRRQLLPKVYTFNGALYINQVDMLFREKTFVNEETIPFIMDRYKSIDIDDILDAKLVEVILKENGNV